MQQARPCLRVCGRSAAVRRFQTQRNHKTLCGSGARVGHAAPWARCRLFAKASLAPGKLQGAGTLAGSRVASQARSRRGQRDCADNSRSQGHRLRARRVMHALLGWHDKRCAEEETLRVSTRVRGRPSTVRIPPASSRITGRPRGRSHHPAQMTDAFRRARGARRQAGRRASSRLLPDTCMHAFSSRRRCHATVGEPAARVVATAALTQDVSSRLDCASLAVQEPQRGYMIDIGYSCENKKACRMAAPLKGAFSTANGLSFFNHHSLASRCRTLVRATWA